MAPATDYPTPAHSEPCHVMPEETFWRRALAAPGESTAFDRAREAQAVEDIDWTFLPRPVAS